MRPQLPDIAGTAAGRDLPGHKVIFRIAILFDRLAGDQVVDLSDREAGHGDVEAIIEAQQGFQFFRQNLLIPACIECELVVRQHIGPLLRRGHTLQPHTRDLSHSQKLCGRKPAMAGEHHVVLVDEDGIGEAETLDTVGNLPDLLAAMDPRVARIGLQGPRREIFDL